MAPNDRLYCYKRGVGFEEMELLVRVSLYASSTRHLGLSRKLFSIVWIVGTVGGKGIRVFRIAII